MCAYVVLYVIATNLISVKLYPFVFIPISLVLCKVRDFFFSGIATVL